MVKRIFRGLGFAILFSLLLSGGVIAGPVAQIMVTVTISSDTDGDGLPDEWELNYFEHLDYGCEDDPDGDGYTSCEEYEGGSDPADATSLPFGVPTMVHIEPPKWDLKWLDPFDDLGGKGVEGRSGDKKRITGYISLENVEVETIIPTFKVPLLKVGKGYDDFVVVGVVAAEDDRRHERKKIRSVTLRYVGSDEVDILASSGNKTWDFYADKGSDTITMDAGAGEHLERNTVLSYYTIEPPLYSAADIIPETILLNGRVPIIEGSAELITKDPSKLEQPRVIAEPPFIIVKEHRHHVSITNLDAPGRITLKIGNQTILEDEPYPVNWHDRFHLDDDGEIQEIRIKTDIKKDELRIDHHNLQAQAEIYLDGVLSLTILPDVKLVVLKVKFNRFEAISSLPKEVFERGTDWEVATSEGVELAGKDPGKHIKITNLGDPTKVKLVVGGSMIFDDEPFPIDWKNRHFIVDGERQDMSIDTHGRHNESLYIRCKRLTEDAKLYLDGELVLEISPPPDIEVRITGEIEFDGDPATFDGSVSGTAEIELKGKMPPHYDIDKTYLRINTSGSPGLEIDDIFSDFQVVNFTEGYDSYRISRLDFRYQGSAEEEIRFYTDSHQKHLISTYNVYPGDIFALDVAGIENKKIYIRDSHKHKDIHLAGKKMAENGDVYLECTVIDNSKAPKGFPHYLDLTLGYISAAPEPDLITAYDGKWQELIDTYGVNLTFEPTFIIDGHELHEGHLGEDLVLEY